MEENVKLNIIRFYGIVFFIIGILIYSYGFHNVDLAYNMNNNQIDTSPLGIERNKDQLYSLGLQGLINGIILNIVGFFCILWYLEHN